MIDPMDWREIGVAVGAAAAFGLFALPPGRYLYWASWTPIAFLLGGLGYLALNGATALVGVVFSRATDWQPVQEDEWFLNGLIFAAVGQAILRIQIEGLGLPKTGEPVTLLKLGVGWVTGFVDRRSRDQVLHEVVKLGQQKAAQYGSLRELALAVETAIASFDDEPGERALIEQQLKETKSAALIIRGRETGDGDDARRRLMTFSRSWIERRHLTRASVIPNS